MIRSRLRRLAVTALAVLIACCSLATSAFAQSKRYVWAGYARTPQHDALGDVASQPFDQIRWQTPVDLMPQYVGTFLLIHYGSPLATRKNTIVVPVKTGQFGGFRVDARRGTDGGLIWTHSSDYVLPPHNWTPSFAPAIGKNKLWIPGAGGTLESRTRIDTGVNARVSRVAFYGMESYTANPSEYDATVFINTPLTVDKSGDDIVLSWGHSCLASDGDSEVYEGTIGTFTSHVPVTCATGGALAWTLTPAAGNRYYLVVPTNGVGEGSYGVDGASVERPPSLSACRAQSIDACP